MQLESTLREAYSPLTADRSFSRVAFWTLRLLIKLSLFLSASANSLSLRVYHIQILELQLMVRCKFSFDNGIVISGLPGAFVRMI